MALRGRRRIDHGVIAQKSYEMKKGNWSHTDGGGFSTSFPAEKSSNACTPRNLKDSRVVKTKEQCYSAAGITDCSTELQYHPVQSSE